MILHENSNQVLSGAAKKDHLLRKNRPDRGSVTVEAALALPVFLFMMTFFVLLMDIRAARMDARKAIRETAEYMAEYMYFADTSSAASAASPAMCLARYYLYLDEPDRTKAYIPVVSFLGSSFPDEDGYVVLEAVLLIRVELPFFGSYQKAEHVRIRQKGYTGRDPTENQSVPADAEYVYVAENGVVYHTDRNCTYISLHPVAGSISAAKEQGYLPCRYCGADAGSAVYITPDGEVYHATPYCSRLKRTVYRKRKSEVDLPPCSKCR